MQKILSLFFNFGFIDLTRELLSGKYGNIYPIFFVIMAVCSS